LAQRAETRSHRTARKASQSVKSAMSQSCSVTACRMSAGVSTMLLHSKQRLFRKRVASSSLLPGKYLAESEQAGLPAHLTPTSGNV
jgi:hypothetical protein